MQGTLSIRNRHLSEIVIGLDRATENQYRHALTFFSRLPQSHVVLWNDGPRLRAIDARLKQQNLEPKEMGKGRNVWYCLGYIMAGKVESVALHDCDITTYKRELLARLIYPIANPNFNYDFCKGYYARIADGSVNGRVCRLLRTLIQHHTDNTVIITETNLPNRENLTYFGNANEAHVIYNFSLPPLLLNTLATGSGRHLKSWLMSMPPAMMGTTYLNFIASHDGIGLRPAEGLLSEAGIAELASAMESFGGQISWRALDNGRKKPYQSVWLTNQLYS